MYLNWWHRPAVLSYHSRTRPCNRGLSTCHRNVTSHSDCWLDVACEASAVAHFTIYLVVLGEFAGATKRSRRVKNGQARSRFLAPGLGAVLVTYDWLVAQTKRNFRVDLCPRTSPHHVQLNCISQHIAVATLQGAPIKNSPRKKSISPELYQIFAPDLCCLQRSI